MTLADLQKMIETVVKLYEKKDPCVRDVSLFLRMHYVLEEKWAVAGADESGTIQEMMSVLHTKFIATFLQSFGHQTPISDLHCMFRMLMDLYEKGEQCGIIESLFPEMHGILNKRLDLAGNDEDEVGDEVGTDEDGDEDGEVGDGEEEVGTGLMRLGLMRRRIISFGL
jgi:hypothetical protein